MAKQTKEQMELAELRTRLSKQDEMLTEQSKKTDNMFDTLKEVLTLLGGSAAMGVVGIRQEVKTLKDTVSELQKREAMAGKWVISVNNIPGFLVTAVMLIGGIFSIIETYRTVFMKEEPKAPVQQEQRMKQIPRDTAFAHFYESHQA